MKNVNKIGLGLLTVLTLAGCQVEKDPSKVKFDEFSPNYTYKGSQAAADAQVATGNRHDATLRAAHFDGPRLNSLGTNKLASMLKTDATWTLTIYFDVANDDLLADRKNAVSEYLKEKGLPESKIALKDGYNPNAGGLAQNGLIGLSKMEEGAGGTQSGAQGAATTAK